MVLKLCEFVRFTALCIRLHTVCLLGRTLGMRTNISAKISKFQNLSKITFDHVKISQQGILIGSCVIFYKILLFPPIFLWSPCNLQFCIWQLENTNHLKIYVPELLGLQFDKSFCILEKVGVFFTNAVILLTKSWNITKNWKN